MGADANLEYDGGLDVTLVFSGANPSANTTNALTLGQGTGFRVPTGFRFHPILISVASNADLTAGTLTAVVRSTPSGGSIGTVANGPTAALSDTVQSATGTAAVGATTVAAGALVTAALVADASYAPVTADVDVVIVGKLLPA